MKKSEMVKALQNRFCTSDVDAIADLADEIIDFLVSKGMQPPAYEKFVEAKGIASPSPEMKLFYKIPYNEWEPENETQ
jgi:hypothetical protein